MVLVRQLADLVAPPHGPKCSGLGCMQHSLDIVRLLLSSPQPTSPARRSRSKSRYCTSVECFLRSLDLLPAKRWCIADSQERFGAACDPQHSPADKVTAKQAGTPRHRIPPPDRFRLRPHCMRMRPTFRCQLPHPHRLLRNPLALALHTCQILT